MIDSVSVAEKIRYYTSDGHWSPEGLAEYLIGSLDCSTLREENEEWSRRYGALYEDAEKRTARNAELVKALEKIVEGKEVPDPLDDGRSTIMTDLGLDEIDQIARAVLEQSNEA